MTEKDTQTESGRIETDGGAPRHESVDYLDAEINLFKPSTPFMRDHLKVVWGTFVVWVLMVFGPVTATVLAPELMTETIVLGFQLHFLLTAIGGPASALVLSAVYAWQRDRLDQAYGISHTSKSGQDSASATATDGGERQ